MSDINWPDFEAGALWNNKANIGGHITLDKGTPQERHVKLTLWPNSYKDPNHPKYDPNHNPKSPDFRVYVDVPDDEDFERNKAAAQNADVPAEAAGEEVPF